MRGKGESRLDRSCAGTCMHLPAWHCVPAARRAAADRAATAAITPLLASSVFPLAASVLHVVCQTVLAPLPHHVHAGQ